MNTISLSIDERFNGPPGSANGGYICGLIAAQLPVAVEITLRKPPPLMKAMALTENEQGWMLMDGETLIAEAKAVEWALEVPAPPDLAAAKASVAGFPGFDFHAFPTCFVCGPERPEKDGLSLFPGPVAGMGQVACPWMPASEFADTRGEAINTPFVWAALDCPGAYAVSNRHIPLVLGRMAAKELLPIQPEVPAVVTGWSLGQEGRKYFSGTSIWQDERLCAYARATWISLNT